MTSENKPQRQIGVYSADSLLLEKVSSVVNAFINRVQRQILLEDSQKDKARSCKISWIIYLANNSLERVLYNKIPYWKLKGLSDISDRYFERCSTILGQFSNFPGIFLKLWLCQKSH